MSTQHTPTPWTQREVRGPIAKDTYQAVIIDANGEGVADVMHGPTATADAAHIVRCVNSHDALVEALERLMRSWLAMHNSKSCEYSGDHPIAIARAALQAATEQS